MAIHMEGEPAADDDGDEGDEESAEEFEGRVYLALMQVARSSSERVRNALGSCVMLGTPYEGAPDIVRQTIRKFIESAEL